MNCGKLAASEDLHSPVGLDRTTGRGKTKHAMDKARLRPATSSSGTPIRGLFRARGILAFELARSLSAGRLVYARPLSRLVTDAHSNTRGRRRLLGAAELRGREQTERRPRRGEGRAGPARQLSVQPNPRARVAGIVAQICHCARYNCTYNVRDLDTAVHLHVLTECRVFRVWTAFPPAFQAHGGDTGAWLWLRWRTSLQGRCG